MLAATSTTLTRLGVDHWLCSGCLLGAVRDGGNWLKNDGDGDLSMTAKNFKKLDRKAKQFIKLLNKQGKKSGNHYAFQTYPDGCIVKGRMAQSDKSLR